ncbi:hypothetical protein A5643_08735 [Mycobacterium sp. 1274756.6]|nr:hypothetical protein A5643_08735 [Mycobacterium sp. 1274756.6]
MTLRHEVDAGTRTEPQSTFGAFAQLLVNKGLGHEDQCLAEYRAQGKSVLPVPEKRPDESFEAWVGRVGNPLDGRYDVVYQMPFIHDGVRGVADFLERVIDGDGCVSYEPVDAKLARAEAKPGHVLQLCFYADAIASLTGARPKHIHLWLGSGERESLRADDFAPYWRRLRTQLVTVLAAGPGADTVPRPNAHCDFCEFRPVCDQHWREHKVLDLVAGIRRPEVTTLEDAGTLTMAQLAALSEPVDGLRPLRIERLAGQAALQVQAAAQPDDPPPFTMIAPGEDPTWGRGFEQLPYPDAGDVFLDFEGHPFWRVETGLFFLFGLLERGDDGAWSYRSWWAHDLDAEADAVASLIDYLHQRRERFPAMHVYHYNHTERSQLVSLSQKHGVAQDKLVELIETGMFIDLLVVARNAIQVGTESYGLKSLERLTDFQRSHAIDKGAGAVLAYEHYMADGDQADLDRIEVYNEDDVRATMALRDWLVEQRPAGSPWRDAYLEPEPELPELDERIAELHTFDVHTPQYLLGDLLGYWLREWLVYRERTKARLDDESSNLFDDQDALDELRFVGAIEKQGKQRYPAMRFSYPRQEAGDFRGDRLSVWFLASDANLLNPSVRDLDAGTGTVDLVWNNKAQEAGVLPKRVVLKSWVSTATKLAALSDFADRLLASGDINSATWALLNRETPRFTDGGGPAAGAFTDDLDDMTRWVTKLDSSYAAVQGPPGTGKTYSAAHLIHALVTANPGRRVGITATTHLAIDNVLEETVAVFAANGDADSLRAVRRVSSEPANPLPGVTYAMSNPDSADKGFNVVAGTTWLFASKEMQKAAVDVLLVDEAGQLSLADALAASCAASNLVLLGDPLQLPQVAQADHPRNSGRSVLEHVLDGNVTIPDDRGVFLSQTRRMHPDVCNFVSAEIYDGRLTSHPDCARQSTVAGTGLRWLRAEHQGNSTASPEEAELIAAEITRLIGTPWTDQAGIEKPLTVHDFMVVAPYNDQVRAIRERLNADAATRGVPVGTVDKFQGREAAVVFFSMTTSTGAELPRGVEFLFSRNRLNVAISRARCLAYLVCTEELLNTRARDVEDMRLIATLNAVVEYALSQTGERD